MVQISLNVKKFRRGNCKLKCVKLKCITVYFFLVARLASERIAPLVKKMDEEQKFDDGIVQALFENGVRTNTVQNKIHTTIDG